MAACVFCQILAGEIPAEIVAESDRAIAFLDARPLFKGHALVIPRAHFETLGDLPADELAPFFAEVKRVALAVERGLSADGTFVALNNRVSQSVPHLHAHVVPRHFKDGLRGFFWPRVKYTSDDERRDFADRVRKAIV